MDVEFHICGKGFVGCPGDASAFARRLLRLWDDAPISGAKPPLYHWHKHFDPYAGSASVGSQYQIEQTSNPSVNPVFILFAQTIGTPLRMPHDNWGDLRRWLNEKGFGFVSLLGEAPYLDSDRPPEGAIPLSGTMFELFDALKTGDRTHLVIYDLSGFTELPDPDTPEHQRQRAWRARLIAELSKTYTVRVPKDETEFDQWAMADLRIGLKLPELDPRYSPLPSLAAVGVDEPLLFGRSELIETLSRRILTDGAPFTRVLGVSGAGKSSLLRAGLMGGWFGRSQGQAARHAKATALLIEPLQLGSLDPDPLRAFGLVLTGGFPGRDTGTVGPSPQAIASAPPDLAPPSGDRAADLDVARAWWDDLAAPLDGPFVLILDQAEQIDAQARREARERTDRQSGADPTPGLSPPWRRFVDLIASLAGVADPALQAPPHETGPSRFRLVLGLHRESAIDLWACDAVGLAASPPIEAPTLTDWRTVIDKTIAAYGLGLDEPLLTSMTKEADRLTNERAPLHLDAKIDDDARYDRASVLPLVKVALQRLIGAWRQDLDLRAATELKETDKTLSFSKFAAFAGIADSVDALGETAIGLWVEALSQGRPVRGLIEGEAFERDCARRFDHLFMGLIDVDKRGRAELTYIRRTGDLARAEADLLEALKGADLLTGPDAEHWRLPHRTVIANWSRGRDFIDRHETRLETKGRLVAAYDYPVAAEDWKASDIGPFLDLAFGWIGNDEEEDAKLRDYLCSGLTRRFKPERFSLESDDPLDTLPLRTLAFGETAWAERLFERAMTDRSRDRKGGLWTITAAAFGRRDWLERIFAPIMPSSRGCFANYIDAKTGAFPLLMAAQDGHAECVRLLLDKDADPNQIDAKIGALPLLMAAQNGHAECVRLLLDKDADPNQIDETNGAFPLIMAAQNGHAECVRLLLDKDADPNQIDETNGGFPLLMAAQNGHAECVRPLLDKDADPNRVNETHGAFPLLMAAQDGHAECVRLLLDKDADPNRVNQKSRNFPLLTAAQNGHAECVRLLLDKDADPNRVNQKSRNFPLLMAAENGHAECVRLLLDKDAAPNRVNETNGTFPLLVAARNGYAECVRLLLDKDAAANRVNETNGAFPLILAAQNGHAECLRLLLDKDADPNWVNQKSRNFSLLMAAQAGHAECVRLLLDKAADPNRVNETNGTFPLLMAAQNGYAECVRLLLDKDAAANRVNETDGAFPLLMAAQNGYAECVRLLLDKDAAANRVNETDGAFPLLMAAQNGHAECVRLLLDKDADPNQIDEMNGTFPLLMAAQDGHAECVRLLLDKDADPNQIHEPSGHTPLTIALEMRRWLVLRLFGQMPGVLDAAPPAIRERFEALSSLIEHPPEEPRANSDTSATPSPTTPGVQTAVALPVRAGRLVQQDRGTPIWDALGLGAERIETASVRREAWRLNVWGDALVSASFRLAGAPVELQALLFDSRLFERPRVCGPGFDVDGLARSLSQARRPLDLRDQDAALLWASLLITCGGGVPILPESPWPPVQDIALPPTAYPEEYWRPWRFARTSAGPTATLPILFEDRMLRVSIHIPEDGVGAAMIGRPDVIMSGLRLSMSRFVRLTEGGPQMWLVRDGRDE